MGMFDIDDSLVKETDQKANYDEQLRKAKVLCIRGEYAAALAIYNAILDKDFENEGALIGILRVHSRDFRDLKGEQLDNDIHAIESLYPNTNDPDYLAYKQKRNGTSNSANTSSKPNDLMSDIIKAFSSSGTETEAKKETFSKPAASSKHDLFLKYKKEGDTAYTNKEVYKGIKAYETALSYAESDDDLISVYPFLAYLHEEIEEPHKSIDYMLKALKSGYKNNDPQTYAYIGNLYFGLKDWTNALKYYKMTIARHGNVAFRAYSLGVIQFRMGFCCVELKDKAQGLVHYEAAIAISDTPEYILSAAYNNAAILYLYQNEGVTQSKEKGKQYTIKAAKLGSQSSIKRAKDYGWTV